MQQSSKARITEIDITGPSRALAVLRWSDYILVIGCGLGAASMAVQSVLAAMSAQWSEFLMTAVMMGALGVAAYTGWRHVGVINPRVWRSYLLLFPLLAGVSVVFALILGAVWVADGINPFTGDLQSMIAFAAYLQFVAVAVPGFLCVLLLRRMRIAPMNVRLADLLEDLNGRGGEPAARWDNVQRIDMRRGVMFGLAGMALVLAAQLAPVSTDSRYASTVFRGIEQATMFGFFLLIRARRYFQVSADSLLAVDKRSPILFLRSFADDEEQQYGSSHRALLDFSLETRLANHFHRFGPFIAIGSPSDSVPQPGAARVHISDDQWQSRVIDWMKASHAIVMYCGITQWVNWELRQVIESGRSTSLILMFPEVKGWRPSRRREDIASRTEQIRQVFHDTPWNEELQEFNDFGGLRAMLFREDGSMLMIRSGSHGRDAYHLAALVAHQQLLNPEINEAGVRADVAVPSRGRAKAVAAALAGAAAVLFAGLYVLGTSEGNRLAFERGELYYNDPVTREEAQRVGEYLRGLEIFTAQKAATVQFDKEDERYKIRFVVDPAVAEGTLVNVQFAVIGNDIAHNVLSGMPLDVILCDENLKPLRTLVPSARLQVGKSEILYTDPVTAEAARAVAGQLQEIGFFAADRTTSVHISREEGTYQLRFVVDPSRANDGETVQAFSEIARMIAQASLGAEPVVVHLCDNELQTLKSQRVEQPAMGRRRAS